MKAKAAVALYFTDVQTIKNIQIKFENETNQ